jgi:hypothetical protein
MAEVNQVVQKVAEQVFGHGFPGGQSGQTKTFILQEVRAVKAFSDNLNPLSMLHVSDAAGSKGILQHRLYLRMRSERMGM